MHDFFRGAGAMIRAVPLILQTPELRKRAWLPLVTNVIVVGLGVPVIVYFSVKWVGGMIPDGQWWQMTARLLAQLLAVAVSAVAAFFVMTVLAGAITGPQNTRLSRAVERTLVERRGGIYAQNTPPFIKDAAQNLILSVVLLLMSALCYLPILALQLIPGIGQILFFICSILYGAFALSLNFGDYTFERHFTRFRDKVRYVLSHKPLYLGYGIASFGLMLIPFLNLVLLPLCVAGATIIFVEEEITKG